MKLFAYIRGEFSEEKYKQLLMKYQVTHILINISNSEKRSQPENSVDEILKMLDAGDVLIINDLSSLNKTLSELAIFLKKLEEKRVELILLNKDRVFKSLTDSEFLELIIDVNKENKKVIKERVKQSTKDTKSVGRPKLSQEKIDRIRWLRKNKKYSLKKVADLCGVSVGTVYKYAIK